MIWLSAFLMGASATMSPCQQGTTLTTNHVTVGHIRSNIEGISQWIQQHQNNLDMFKEFVEASNSRITYSHYTDNVDNDINDFRTKMTAMKNNHGVDVFFCPYSSGQTTNCLIVADELKTPCIGFGSSGHSLYVNTSTVPETRRTPYFHCFNFWGRDTIAPFMGVFYTAGARTITVFYEDNPYHYDNVLGMELYLENNKLDKPDYKIVNKKIIDPSAFSEPNYFERQFEIEPTDMVVFLLYRQNCDRMQEVLYDNENYYPLIMLAATCGGKVFEDLGEKGAFVTAPIWWDRRLSTQAYREPADCEGCLFKATATKSSAAIYADGYNKRFGKYPHPIEACMMANFYKIHMAALQSLNCDFSDGEQRDMNFYLDGVTMSSSFYGPLGSSKFGHNPFSSPYLVQYRAQGGSPQELVVPAELSTSQLIYPMPAYEDRWCYPNCIACPQCVFLNNVWVYGFFTSVTCAVLFSGMVYALEPTNQTSREHFPWFVRIGFVISIVYSAFEIISGLLSALNMFYLDDDSIHLSTVAKTFFVILNLIDVAVACYSLCICTYGIFVIYCVLQEQTGKKMDEFQMHDIIVGMNMTFGVLGVVVNFIIIVVTLFIVQTSTIAINSASSIVYDLCFSTGELILSMLTLHNTIEIINGFEAGTTPGTAIAQSFRAAASKRVGAEDN